MIRRLFFLIIAIGAMPDSTAFSQMGGDFKAPPSSERETTQGTHPYYVGMSKESLYQIYPRASRRNYFRNGNEEWIVYDDILTTSDLRDTIVFYLKDGKVSGWDKKALPLAPAERLKMIEDRHKHSVGSAQSASGYTDRGVSYKDQTRRQRIEQDRGRLYR